MAKVKVVRVIEMEGEVAWVQETLAKSWLSVGNAQVVARGTITETSRLMTPVFDTQTVLGNKEKA